MIAAGQFARGSLKRRIRAYIQIYTFKSDRRFWLIYELAEIGFDNN